MEQGQERHEALNSEMMLKNLVLRQQRRMQAMTELDDKITVSFSAGYKRVSTLRTIVAEVRKLDVGEQWMRGKCGNRPSVHQLEDYPEEMSRLARIMMDFDPVDRSLMRELYCNYLDVVQMGMRDEFIAIMQEATLKRAAAEAADESAVEPPVSESS